MKLEKIRQNKEKEMAKQELHPIHQKIIYTEFLNLYYRPNV